MTETTETTTPVTWPKDVYFRHFHHRTGQRVTFCFRRLSQTDEEVVFQVPYSRYNPKHEPATYTRRVARRLAFNKLERKGVRDRVGVSNGRVEIIQSPDVFNITVDKAGGRTYATSIMNALVEMGVMPSNFGVYTDVHAGRYQDYLWDATRGLVKNAVVKAA